MAEADVLGGGDGEGALVGKMVKEVAAFEGQWYVGAD